MLGWDSHLSSAVHWSLLLLGFKREESEEEEVEEQQQEEEVGESRNTYGVMIGNRSEGAAADRAHCHRCNWGEHPCSIPRWQGAPCEENNVQDINDWPPGAAKRLDYNTFIHIPMPMTRTACSGKER